MRPTDVLRREHELILQALGLLDRLADKIASGAPVAATAARPLAAFFRDFADAFHHAKEEGVLFPAMAAAGMPAQGGPIAVMLHEHVLGRALVKTLNAEAHLEGEVARGRFVEAARGYVDLLRAHIHKEDHILFRMADQLLDPAGDAQLLADYARRVEEAVAPGLQERCVVELDGVAAQL